MVTPPGLIWLTAMQHAEVLAAAVIARAKLSADGAQAEVLAAADRIINAVGAFKVPTPDDFFVLYAYASRTRQQQNRWGK